MKTGNTFNINYDWVNHLHLGMKCSFIWSETPQGHRYWQEVADALESLVKDDEPTEEAA